MRARTRNVEPVELASLFRLFEHEYGDAYVRLVAELRERYPEITRPGRRTGRALRNICFIVWCSFRDGEQTLIPALFRAAVLLSAQDDYYDNPRIPAAQKDSFCSAIKHALRTNSFRHELGRNHQLRDLGSLWSYVAGTIPRRPRELRTFWIEAACQLNDAMAAENRSARRRATITYEEYMRTAIHSIGMVFIWATYLAHEHVPMSMMREIAPILLRGARVVRLSNDMAGGRGAGARMRRLVAQEAQAFHGSIEELDVAPHVRHVLIHSMDLLREFYRRSDFGRAPAW